MTYAILATGPSMDQATADAVRGLKVIVVSDAYRLAPWADALVSADSAWWQHHKPEFAGRRFSALGAKGTEKIAGVPSSSNSGRLAIRVARHLGAKRIILLGFDGHGSHYFGAHPTPLKNTTETRRKVHADQHRQEARECSREGVEVFNCTPGTALTCYKTADLKDVMC